VITFDLYTMNFNLLFAVVGALNFTIKFLINTNRNQHFLMFTGKDTEAHLYRNGETVTLYLQNENKTEIYKETILDTLEFSWEGFKINGTEMKKVQSNDTLDLEFTEFVFLSPILDVQTNYLKEEKVVSLPDPSNIKYGYIVCIVLIVAIVFDSKPKVNQLIRQMINKEESQDYEKMKKIEQPYETIPLENIDII